MRRSARRTNSSQGTTADTGLPGRPDTRRAAPPEGAEGERVAGLDLDAPEEESAAELLEDAARVVAIADRDTRRRHDRVGGEPRGEPALDLLGPIGRDPEVDGQGA